jgi:transposase/prophage antirepressor-like protein
MVYWRKSKGGDVGMMTRRDGVQQKMLCVTLESLMPQEHFLRRLDSLMDFSFIYQRVESLYSRRGRPSIDPVVVVKMLLLGYLYGIDSERRLEQEVRVNIAYRWFLGIDLDEPVPDHSTFSQLRRRKFNGAALFEELFDEVVRKCIEHGLIDGKLLLTDSTHVRANARNDVVERVAVEAEPSAYLQRLNEQAVKDGVYPKHRKEKAKGYKELVKSPADPDAGFMKRTGKPLGFYYLSHQTCDARHGLITDVHTTPGNVPDSTVHSERIKRQIAVFGFKPEAVCADSAYDSSEIHKDMLDMGIRTYIPKRNLPKPASGVFSEADFIYDRESDTLTCPNACRLIFSNYRDRLGQKRYKASAGECSACPLRSRCISGEAKYRVVERAYFKWASEEQHLRNDGTPGYYEALRLRKIYCEGNFSHQKAEHNLRRLRKRGLGKAHEHCLLSATALNLKRMVKLLTTRKHPGVSLRKTLSAIGRSSMLYPMALLSTGPKRRTLTNGGAQEMSFIPEGDVYRLIVHSKLPSAERFERWVFDEVLPSLRANGIYITDPLVKQIVEDPDYLYALWDTLKRQNERLQSQDEIISAQSEELDLNDCLIDDLSWKANYYDDFIDESDGVTIRVAAKQIGVPERALVSLLIGCHYLYRCDGRLLPYADRRCAGLFAVREHRTLITPIGKARILELLDFLASEPEAAS